MPRSTASILVLAGAAACAPARERTDPPAMAAFTPAQVVSQATENGATPMFLATPAGDRVVAWVSAAGGGSDGVANFAVTPAGAGDARPVVQVRDPLGPIEPHGEAPPKLAADGAGRLFFLYAVGKEVPGQRFPVSALRFIRSEDGGATWSAPVTVNDPGRFGAFGAHNFHALTAGPDGTLLATWLHAPMGKSGVALSRSTDQGRTWEPMRMIFADSTCPCCRTAVAMDGSGSIWVAWRRIFDGNVRDVVVMRSRDGGVTWDAPVRPHADEWVYPGCPHAGPSLALGAEGVLHLAWWTGKEGAAGVYHARSADGGATWVTTPLATGARSTPAHVQLVTAPGGAVVVAWDDGLSALPRVLLRRSLDGGATFAPVEVLSDSGVAATFPVLAVAGDSLAVAWSQATGAEHRAALARRADMRDPNAVMRLPRVGQSEILVRTGPLRPASSPSLAGALPSRANALDHPDP